MSLADDLKAIRDRAIAKGMKLLTIEEIDEVLGRASPSEAVQPIINELAAIADACADLHQNRNRPDSDPIMGWDNAKLTLGTVRLARSLRGRSEGKE